MNSRTRFMVTGLAAGIVTGILGSGGGIILVPLLASFCKEDEDRIFPCSLSIMLPICLCSLIIQKRQVSVSFLEALPYLLGGLIGGILSVIAAKRVSPVWLHRLFGCILLWSGFKCLIS